MKVIFSYGGSILAPNKIDEEMMKKTAALLKNISRKHRVAVVVGGGRPAREKIQEAREKGESETYCDHVGILATRQNAGELRDELGETAVDRIPETLHEAAGLFGDKILVMGGTEPGHSTDAVAALLADWIQADLFINASNIDYVYDKNPKENQDAKPVKKLTPDELIHMVSNMDSNAGGYALIDYTAAKTIKRSGIKTIVLDGTDLENIEKAIEGREYRGTVIE